MCILKTKQYQPNKSQLMSFFMSGQCLAVGHSATDQPVPAWVEEPVIPLGQSSSGGATNNPPFPIFRDSRLPKLAYYC